MHFCGRGWNGERITDLRNMNDLLIGTAGFFLYFIYDVNSVEWNNRLLQKLFGAGSLCVVLSTIDFVRVSFVRQQAWGLFRIGFAVFGLLFLGLLIYTLFFALPFEQTYLEESRMRKAYTEGIYSLCRHPGVLWFAGLYLCLWGMTGSLSGGVFFVLMIVWNIIYIIFQDLWTFPRTFTNYNEYKRGTPFLIPDGKSVRACLLSIRGLKRD